MQSDVDTNDRPGDGARTTPPTTPAQRGAGSPTGSTAPTGTSPSSTAGSTSSTPPPPTGTGTTAAGTTGTGSTTSGNPTFGSGTPSPDNGTAGLVPASRAATGGRPGLNGGQAGSAPTRPDVQALLDAEYAATVRERWFGVQSAFVDDPESAVREASAVLEDSIAAIGRGLEKLRRSVTDAAEAAEGTEDLRVALLRHREVIGRLLQL